MAEIIIKNLVLRTIVGINENERKKKQEVIVNIKFETEPDLAIQSDNITDTVNYRSLTKKIINAAENSNFFLLEKLTDFILQIVMEDKRILKATVRVDKHHVLRFTESVAVELSAKK
jgi:D-erythro-7,8-dihydroneopterin triphosphate epimerase|tara:strand:+ start:99 stop:449 length:351 start_codon:yes stop_codon:yes gene_type:complete